MNSRVFSLSMMLFQKIKGKKSIAVRLHLEYEIRPNLYCWNEFVWMVPEFPKVEACAASLQISTKIIRVFGCLTYNSLVRDNCHHIMQAKTFLVASHVSSPFFSRLWNSSVGNIPFLRLHAPARCFFRPRLQSFWAEYTNDNKCLIERLQLGGVLKSRRVAETMEQIDRKLFVPDKTYAYADQPMPIGFNATISAPHMHCLCLELLESFLKPGMHALDVGSGTGYLTACFSIMVGKEGRAVGVEHIPELVEKCIDSVKVSMAAPILEAGRLSFHVGDGRLGWPNEAPYDAIHVGAAASEVPDALLEQLKSGGRMVIPVGDHFQELRVIDKQKDGSVKDWSETSVRYVPLTSRNEQLGI